MRVLNGNTCRSLTLCWYGLEDSESNEDKVATRTQRRVAPLCLNGGPFMVFDGLVHAGWRA